MLGNLSQNRHKSNVGLTGTGGRSNQNRPGLLECNRVHYRLDLVQMRRTSKGLMTKLGHLFLDANEVSLFNGRLWRWRYLNPLPVVIVLLVHFAFVAIRELLGINLCLLLLSVINLDVSVLHLLRMLQHIAIKTLHGALFESESFVFSDQRFIESERNK